MIGAMLEQGFRDIVADFSRNDFIDSGGLGETVRSLTTCSRAGGSFTLNRVGRRVHDLLDITKLLPVFNVLDVDYSHLRQFELSAGDLSGLRAASRVGALPTISIVSDITPELLRSLKEDPARLHSLTPEQFENLACERLGRMGFVVTKAGATNRKDGGIDIIGAKRDAAVGDFLVAAQVKHHRGGQKTGSDKVRDLLSFKNTVFRFGLLVTNTGFTEDAKWIAVQGDNRWFAKLRDFEDIREWLEENFASEGLAELPHEIELAPGVTINVPRPKGARRN